MRVVTIPAKEKFVFDLLMKVHDEGLILQTTDGQQFALMPLTEWQSYTVGDSDDFAQEVKTTAENDDLMTLLATRQSDPTGISIEDVKKELGLL